jgi:hypothetical protein
VNKYVGGYANVYVSEYVNEQVKVYVNEGYWYLLEQKQVSVFKLTMQVVQKVARKT